MRTAAAIVLATLVAGCDSPTGPGVNVTGTYAGNYTAMGRTYYGTLQLTQSGRAIGGSLTTSVGRSADVSGMVSGTRLTVDLTFTDSCGGSATSTADIVSEGSRLVGNYTADDCVGSYSGGYDLVRQ